MDASKELNKIAQEVSDNLVDGDKIANEILDVSDEIKVAQDKERIVEEINDVIDELEDLEEGVAEDIDDTISELEEVGDAAINDDEEDEIAIEEDNVGINTDSPSAHVDVVSKKKNMKKASLINEGDLIIAVNPTHGLYKGRRYIAGEKIEKNYIVVAEEDGTEVGIFRSDRFCLDHHEY